MIELWQVASGQAPGRQTSAQVTLFKSVGTALQDLSLAIAVYRRARERGIGREPGEFPHVRPSANDREIRDKLVQACRVLFAEGHEHFYLGHVSARPHRPGRS
jgi:hypothetical protein